MAEPVLTVGQMRHREERTWAGGISQADVIRRAGAAVGAVAWRLTGPGDPVLLLAGMGHNGDDALGAAGALRDRDVLSLRLSDSQAFESARGWLRTRAGDPRALVVDGMFGLGLNRPMGSDWSVLAAEVNRSRVRVLSVDVPSGLDAETGLPLGEAITATVTLAMGSVKTGLLREEGARHVGRLELAADIGLEPSDVESDLWWTLPADFSNFPPRRPVEGHKGTFGHVAIVAGSEGFHGAAVLAAQGALRARPGLVTVFTDPRCYLPVAAQLRAAMVRPWPGSRIAAEGFTAIVMGPGLASAGLSPSVPEEVQRLWREAACPVLVDASALDWLPSGGPCAGPRAITPHPGEAARLLGAGEGPAARAGTVSVQADRLGAVRRLADRWPEGEITVVLKGRHTLVGGRSGRCHVNSTGNPGLAQGGTGDVLAGFLGGLLAQPALQGDLSLPIRFGVWRHGAAADALEADRRGWTTEDLVEVLGR